MSILHGRPTSPTDELAHAVGDLVGTVIGGERCSADPSAQLAYLTDRCGESELRLGADATVRSGSVLYAGSTIGDDLATGHNVVIREQCTIGRDLSVWSNSIIDYGCVIGNGVKIHCNCYIAQFTVIEDEAFLAPGVNIANDLYPGDDRSADVMAGPVIEAGAQIGIGATLLPYVRIGAGAIVGSGAVVTRDVPAGTVAYGNPAKPKLAVTDLRPIEQRAPADHPLR